jgi:hypothetical protein
MWKTAQAMHKGSHKHDNEELSLDTFRYFIIGAKSAEVLIERKTLEVWSEERRLFFVSVFAQGTQVSGSTTVAIIFHYILHQAR